MRALLIFFFLIPLYHARPASSGDEFTPRQVFRAVFENSVFHYYSRNYILAAFQFSSLLEEFPDYKRSEVLGYYISSLSYLGQGKAEYIQKHKDLLSSQVLFTLVNNYQMRGAHQKASHVLGLISFSGLSGREKEKYHFLKGRSLIAADQHKEALESLDRIGKESRYYLQGRIFASQIFFRLKKPDRAIAILARMLKTYRKSAEEGQEPLQKAALLLGQIFFEKGEYKRSESYFRKISEGKYFPDALEGRGWVGIKRGEYKKASKIFGVLRKRFPLFYYNQDLPMTHLLTLYYSDNPEKTGRALDDMEGFLKQKSALAKRIIESDEVPERYIYYLLANFSNIQLLEKYSLTEDEKELFKLFQASPELVNLSRGYLEIEQMMAENMRGLNLFNDYAAVFKKRKELFKNFIDLFRNLRPAYFSLKKIIMEIELPFDQIPEKNVQYVTTRLDIAMKEYAKKFKRPLTKLERQLIKILIYEEYVSYRGIERNLPLFTLALKMMNILQGLYGDSGKGWEEEFNRAVEEHNKSARMINKLNSFPTVNKELKKIKSDINSMITRYLRKEAFRVIMQNKRYAGRVAAIREDLLIQGGVKHNAQK